MKGSDFSGHLVEGDFQIAVGFLMRSIKNSLNLEIREEHVF